jgi:hypothetical protein
MKDEGRSGGFDDEPEDVDLSLFENPTCDGFFWIGVVVEHGSLSLEFNFMIGLLKSGQEARREC